MCVLIHVGGEDGLGYFITSIACGAFHSAVLGYKKGEDDKRRDGDKRGEDGKRRDGEKRGVVLTWGNGSDGALGHAVIDEVC